MIVDSDSVTHIQVQPTAQDALHVVHGVISLDCGGMERIVGDLVRKSRAGGKQVSVLCLERPGRLANEVVALGGSVVSLEKPPGIHRPTTEKAIEVLAELRPDVLHTHQIGALWYLGAAAVKINKFPVLHTEHIDNVAKAGSGWRKLKTRVLWCRAARFADRMCCVSDDVARSMLRFGTVPRRKVDVVLNGIDTERYVDRSCRAAVRGEMGIPSDATVLGTVGRLAEVKRHDLLLEALARLLPEFPRLRLLVVGDGPERPRLEQRALELGVRKQTTLAGYQPHPERFLQAMDLFALTSRLEGLPLALLEAWATGLPVVSSAVGGIGKVVANGQTGLLFPSGELAALVAALRELLADPAKAERIARAGQAVVRKDYSLERMASEYQGRYRELIQTSR